MHCSRACAPRARSAGIPNTVRRLEDAVRARVAAVVGAAVEKGAFDAVADVAVPVPLGVLAQLMGLPGADVPRLYEWTEKIEAAQRAPEPAAALDVFVEMAAYLHEQIARQVQEGNADSLVMRLREAEVDGQRLDDTEILVFFGLLVFAGNDTARNTTAGGLLALLDHPAQLRALRDDRPRIPQAVEEILRFTSVVNYFARTATRDTELAGQAIAEGDKVVMWYCSASRDEAVYDDPQRFDIARPEHDHCAFGGGGRHFCLGAGLARLELRVVLEELLARAPLLERAGPVERLPSAWANGLTALPVTAG
jgi:methyl-branched lipid omega-hydroxylase